MASDSDFYQKSAIETGKSFWPVGAVVVVFNVVFLLLGSGALQLENCELQNILNGVFWGCISLLFSLFL